MKDIVFVPISEIAIPDGRREPTEEQIDSLVRSIKEVELLNPPTLREGNILVCGRTRLEAYKKLGRTEIPVRILPLDDLHARLAEIDENIERSNLNALEEGQALKERKAIYLTLHPETKKGGDIATASRACTNDFQ